MAVKTRQFDLSVCLGNEPYSHFACWPQTCIKMVTHITYLLLRTASSLSSNHLCPSLLLREYVLARRLRKIDERKENALATSMLYMWPFLYMSVANKRIGNKAH